MSVNRTAHIAFGSVLCLSLLTPVLAGPTAKKPAPAKAAKEPKPVPISQEDKDAIQAGYDKSDTALGNKDLKGVFASCASDMVEVNLKGQAASLAMLQAEVQRLILMAHSLNNLTVIQSAVQQDGGAVVTVKEQQDLVVNNPYTHEIGEVKIENICRDFWVKTDQGWLEKRTRVISTTQSVAGPGIIVRGVPHW